MSLTSNLLCRKNKLIAGAFFADYDNVIPKQAISYTQTKIQAIVHSATGNKVVKSTVSTLLPSSNLLTFCLSICMLDT